jgi:hypothetical protein
VISTVGPVNHKKKLKKMQEEDLKRIQQQMALDAEQ